MKGQKLVKKLKPVWVARFRRWLGLSSWRPIDCCCTKQLHFTNQSRPPALTITMDGYISRPGGNRMEAESAVMPDSRDGVGPTTEWVRPLSWEIFILQLQYPSLPFSWPTMQEGKLHKSVGLKVSHFFFISQTNRKSKSLVWFCLPAIVSPALNLLDHISFWSWSDFEATCSNAPTNSQNNFPQIGTSGSDILDPL